MDLHGPGSVYSNPEKYSEHVERDWKSIVIATSGGRMREVEWGKGVQICTFEKVQISSYKELCGCNVQHGDSF